jgi:hypothetical protein
LLGWKKAYQPFQHGHGAVVNTSYDIRCFPSFKHLRACLLVLFGLVHSFQVNAQAANAGDVFGWVYYQNSGNTTSVNTGGTASTAVRDMGWGPSASSGNSVNWKGSPTIRNGSGNPLVIDVISKTPGSKAAKILSAGAKALPVIGTGVMLWELCKELGFGCGKDSSGNPVVTVSDPLVCSSGTCYEWYIYGYGSPGPYSTAAQACKAKWPAIVALYEPRLKGGPSVLNIGNDFACEGLLDGNMSSIAPLTRGSVVAPQTSSTPSSLQELEDAIASKSGWPTSSRIHDALKESARATGQQIPMESPTVSGPATSKGSTTTTTNPSAGTTTTTTTTHNHTYNDNRVSTTVTTSVNVTNNSTGQGTTTTTTTEPANEQSECEKNPSSLNCADLDTPEGDIPKTEKRITYEAENLGFAGGSCPADVVQTIAGNQVKLVNWQQNCGLITTYAKPMILALASFAALMIIFVGGKPE